MPSRKERRQEAHKARKAARKAGFPSVVAAQPEFNNQEKSMPEFQKPEAAPRLRPRPSSPKSCPPTE